MREVRGPVRFERADRIVLAYCALCLPWRTLAATRPAALDAAAAHVAQVHDDAATAAHLRQLATRQRSRDTPRRP